MSSASERPREERLSRIHFAKTLNRINKGSREERQPSQVTSSPSVSCSTLQLSPPQHSRRCSNLEGFLEREGHEASHYWQVNKVVSRGFTSTFRKACHVTISLPFREVIDTPETCSKFVFSVTMYFRRKS